MPSAGTYAPGAKGGKTQSRCLKPRKSRLVLVLLHKAVFFFLAKLACLFALNGIHLQQGLTILEFYSRAPEALIGYTFKLPNRAVKAPPNGFNILF